MYFMADPKLPEGLLPPPDTRTWQERGEDQRGQFAELTAAAHERQRLVENFNSREEAEFDAYEKRIADVLAATGVKLDNPYRLPLDIPALPDTSGADIRDGQRADFVKKLQGIEARMPDKVAATRSHVPIMQEAEELARAAAARYGRANAAAKDLSGLNSFVADMGGSMGAVFRDPVNLYTAFVGGGAGAGRTLAGRMMARMASEGAVNAGAEAVVQVAAQDWQKQAGVEPSGFWKNVGLAAAFGGGLGGLMQGAGEVLKRTGRATPETDAAFTRMAGGDVADPDLRTMADAMGVKLADDDLADLARARDVDAGLAATLGPDVDPQLADDMARAMVEGSRPPGLRDDFDGGPTVKENLQVAPVVKESLTTAPVVAPDAPTAVHLRDDPGFVGFVAEQNQLRLQKLEQAIAMNEADIAHLRDDGSLDALPSERDFSGMRASDDVDRAHRVVQELESKVAKAKAEVASGKAFNTDDVALQKRFADERGARTIVHADVKAQGLGEVNSVKAGEMAKARLTAVQGPKTTSEAAKGNQSSGPKNKAKVSELSEKGANANQSKTTLDILDALPAGTDIDGNPIVTTHADMTDFATRLDDLADVIAACRAT